jgi:PAS domain S-box-containing protein
VRFTPAVRWLALVAVYILAAKVGFRAAFVAEQVSPVWPPTGLALWAALEFGPRAALPAIWIGAFVANATTHEPFLVAATIATGNTLEAFAGVWLLRRFGGIDRSLDTLRHVTSFVVAAALGSTVISATIGVMTLCASGLQPWPLFASLWWTWWLGDASGALLVAPVLLTMRWWQSHWRTIAVAELTILEAITIGVTVLVFGVRVMPLTGHHPLEYTVFPLVIWAGLRFAHAGAALVSATVSLIAVWGTLNGTGPFSVSSVASAHESIILLQIFTAVIATSGLVLGAAIADRGRSERLRATGHALTAILGTETDLKSAARPMLRAAGETLGWDVGLLWQVDDRQQWLDCVDSWHRDPRFDDFVHDSRARRFPPGLGLPGRVWSSGRPESIYDVVIDPNFPRAPVALHAGLHAGFAFPILVGERVLGIMEFFARRPAEVDAAVAAFMGAVGSQIGQFMERRRAQRELVTSEALNSAIVAAALDCIISIDADGCIVEFNPAASRTFGFNREDVLGRELAEVLIPERLRRQHREALQRSVETGEGAILGRRVEMPALRADGTELIVEIAITKVEDAPRPVFTAHLRDVTERKRVDEERASLLAREQAARLEAEHANRAKDQFLATISHELRTPLTAIIGWASMLRTRRFDPDRLEHIHESIYRNADMQAQIVNDLLDVSRIVTGQLRLDLHPTDVCEVARMSLETIRPTAVAKRVQLDSDLPESPCVVFGDAARLQQVIWNLLSNATKFTPSGGRVILSVRTVASMIAIEVKDTGAGLSAEALPHVFERFWQADSTTTRQHGGLGLGLALVRHLVELHGGEVRAASEGENQGSTFTVSLPVHEGVRRPAGRHPRSERRLAQLQSVSVLVVDDDPSAREVFTAMLEDHGAGVTCAASAAEAIRLLERQQPDVLILDIAMPNEDGLTLLRRIRAAEDRRGDRSIPAIAVTAYAGASHREAILAAGFTEQLPKPVLPHDLVTAVLKAAQNAA